MDSEKNRKNKGWQDSLGLNFIRPDANRPGNYTFEHDGVWLVSQYEEMGVKWNRLAFSWVVIEPTKGEFDWTAYDQIVDACAEADIEILATLGGHFDRPPVPEWAGETLKDVVDNHPEYLENFIQEWVNRYQGKIKFWEILNEPKNHHKGLTVIDYVEKILKPAYRIIKSSDENSIVLPCAYNQLPIIGDSEDFWDAARGYYDIHNTHIYCDWGFFRKETNADKELQEMRKFSEVIKKHNEGDKPIWITEFGWWGTGGLTGTIYKTYRHDPNLYGSKDWQQGKIEPTYQGKNILEHPTVKREDSLRAEWLEDFVKKVLSLPQCEKAFLWVSIDEFEGGYDPEVVYGLKDKGEDVRQVDQWGIIAGDKTWRKTAYVMQELLKE